VLVLDTAEADDAFAAAVQTFVRIPPKIEQPVIAVRCASPSSARKVTIVTADSNALPVVQPTSRPSSRPGRRSSTSVSTWSVA
jgi:hypothetical protein